MGIVGAIGGAAPAYTYLYINALAEAAVRAGMPKGMAVEIAAAMAEGSGRMVRLSGQQPWVLIDQVTSPGGTTVEGLLALQRGGFEPAVHGAVQAVLDKDKPDVKKARGEFSLAAGHTVKKAKEARPCVRRRHTDKGFLLRAEPGL